MSGATLTLRGIRYAEGALARGDLPESGGLSDNERAALEFCREWLRGDTTFALHTSGSTGEPKPILLTRAQMEASARATARALALESGQTSLIALPTRFVAGRMMLVRTLELGLHATLVEPASNPLASLEPVPPFHFASFVPMQMQTLLAERATRAHVDAMGVILLGGGPVAAELEDALQELRAAVWHTYGMTETATHVALRRLNGPQRSEAFVPLPGVELRLDARECLALRGPMTAGAWVQTNDRARLLEEGGFLWLGRVDNVVNTGGVKVAVELLEARLERLLPALGGLAWGERRYFLAGLPDERLGQRLVLAVEGDSVGDEMAATLLAELRSHLGPFEAPRSVIFVKHFTGTPTGKIDRAATIKAALYAETTETTD